MRRITADALQHEKDQLVKQIKNTGERIRLPAFNCEIKEQVHTAVHIASVGQQHLTSTRFITVPIITNVKDLVAGEELLEVILQPEDNDLLRKVEACMPIILWQFWHELMVCRGD